jgi:hypothetical protein
VTARVRLRQVIADYTHAADTDGDHFETAAELLTVVVRTRRSRAEILSAITAAIDTTTDIAVLSLLHNARARTAGDLTAVARQANDSINARTTPHGRTA